MNILRIVIPALFFKLGMAATRWPDKPQARGIWDVLPTFRLWLVESCQRFCSPWVLWRETDEGQVGHARHCFPVVALSPFKKGGKKNKKIKRVELGEGPTWTTPGHPLIPEYYITGSAFLAWVPSSGWGIMILYTYPSSSSSWQVALVTVLLPVPHFHCWQSPDMALMVASHSRFFFTLGPDGCCLHVSHLYWITKPQAFLVPSSGLVSASLSLWSVATLYHGIYPTDCCPQPSLYPKTAGSRGVSYVGVGGPFSLQIFYGNQQKSQGWS